MNNTERITMLENELKESRKREEVYRMIFENAPMGITHFNQDGIITTVNNRFLQIMGSNFEENIGFNLLNDLEDPKMRESVQGALKGKLAKYEGIYRSVIGKREMPLRAIHYQAVAEDGSFAGGLGIFEDLTEQWSARAAQRDSEERYRMIFENSPLGIGHYDQNGVITHCNTRFAEIMGTSKDNILGFNGVKGITNPAMKQALACALQGEIGYYEGNYKSETGQKHTPIRATFCGLYSGDGSIIGGIGVFEDITQRIQAEDALHKSETYNNLILNGISENVVLYEVLSDEQYIFAKVNNNFLHTYGLTEEQVIGKCITDIMPPKLAETWIINNQKVLSTKKPLIVEDNYGEHGIFNLKLFPVIAEHQEITHIILAATNITEQKKMEEHQLKMQRLETVGLLAGGIAHDFNNILTAILGNTSLARMKINGSTEYQGKEKVLEWLLEIDRASHQAKELTQQLLTFAKGGNPILNTVEIGTLLKETADFVIRGSNVSIKYDLAQGLFPVVIDEGQINQVIHNLILNAVQAMPNGGVINVSAQNFLVGAGEFLPLDQGDYVKISITDQGQGIPPENLDRIFDPYFSTKPMGSGLGLTTTFSVVKRHKGYINVDSTVGIGTSFSVYLLASQHKVHNQSEPSVISSSGKGRILLMDDERTIRQVLSEMLTALGYEAVCVKDGIAAIKAYQEAMQKNEPFDVFIADLTIAGGMGGKDTLRLLLDMDPKVKAIVSSGYSNDPVMANYKKYGFLDVVAKPYNLEKLGKVLEKVMNKGNIDDL